jgi:thrombospondin 2/3/4/5
VELGQVPDRRAPDPCHGTVPRRRDSDGDGHGDGAEMAARTDPLDRLPDTFEQRGGRGSLSPDRDGDGTGDGEDNRPLTSNPDQADGDGDGRGDACQLQGAPAR